MLTETDGCRNYVNTMETDIKLSNEPERVSSELMDEMRQENTAYRYLCHLEEARLWIQSCIEEELPPATELEENFRNGVYLAKLAYRISPNTISAKKIYDSNQEIYFKKGLHFRHTDNINHWLKAMEDVGLPSHFHPDTFDVYDKRNMPKMVYCLHVLSLYLFQLGRAPQIQNLYGQVHFSSEQIRAMEKQFERNGVLLPDFSKIQDCISRANRQVLIDRIGKAVLNDDILTLKEALVSLADETEINLGNVDAYMQFLRNVYKESAVNWEEVISTIIEANHNVAIQNFVTNLNLSLESLNKEMMMKCLKNSPEPLDIVESADELYLEEFCTIRKESKYNLTYREIIGGMKVLTAIAQITQSLVNKENLFEVLSNQAAHICGVNSDFVSKYQTLLWQMRETKIHKGSNSFLNHYEIQEAVDKINKQALNQEAIYKINQTIPQNDSKKLFKVLSFPEASILCVEPENSNLYQFLLLERYSKCNDKYINQDEIQIIVNEANKIALKVNYICMSLVTINNAVQDRKSSDLIEALEMLNNLLSNNLHILPQCKDIYVEKLKKLKMEKEKKSESSGKEESDISWIACKVHDYSCCFNIKTLDYIWMCPQLSLDSCYLNQNDIYSIVTEVNSEYTRKQLLKFIEPKIMTLQSYARGFLVRKSISARMDYFRVNVDKIIKIQAWWRSKMYRKMYLAQN